MIETKHTSITELLKKRIIDGHYDKKLPPLRTLMQEFNVSMQTINKAVKPLSIDGFISPGPRGSVIRYSSVKRPQYYAMGLLCPNITNNSETRTFLERVSGWLQFENYNTMFFDQNNERLKRDPEFWNNCPVDVLIFGFRTSTPERIRAVHNAGIIPMARHYSGDLPTHVVEYETFSTLDSVVEQLAAKGYREIALQFHTPLTGYHKYAVAQWRKIREKYGIDCPGYEEPFYFSGPPLSPRKPCPEVILCWHSDCKVLLEQLTASGLADKVKVVSYTYNTSEYRNFIQLSPPDEKIYWDIMGKTLQKILSERPTEFLHATVPFEAVFPSGIPSRV